MQPGALVTVAAVLLAASAQAPREAEGGYWRAGEREGHYRVTVTPAAGEATVRIEWIAHATDASEEETVATQTLSGLGTAQISTPELRTEGTATLLTLDARDPVGGSRRAIAIELGEPGHHHR